MDAKEEEEIGRYVTLVLERTCLLTRQQPEKDTEIYDEVDEIEYKKIVKGRLQRDDFIEDDGVGGYADNGMDDWGDNDQDIHSEEERVIKRTFLISYTCFLIKPHPQRRRR